MRKLIAVTALLFAATTVSAQWRQALNSSTLYWENDNFKMLIGAAILTAHLIPGTNVPGVRGYQVAFAIAGAAALIGVVVAVLVTPTRERLVVAAEASD